MAAPERRTHPHQKRFVPYDAAKHAQPFETVGGVCYPPYARIYDVKQGVSCLLMSPGQLKVKEREYNA